MPPKKEWDGTADDVQRPEKPKEEEKPVRERINAKGNDTPEPPVWARIRNLDYQRDRT